MARRHWCFTYFGDGKPTLGEGCRYLIYQTEKCPDTGRIHQQGYAEFTKQISLKRAGELLGISGAHFEGRKGSRDSAREYCRKTESRLDGPFELGEWISGPGHRTDVHTLGSRVIDGATESEIIREMPDAYMRMYRGMQQLMLRTIPPRQHLTQGYLLVGRAGCGKTSTVYNLEGLSVIYKKSPSNKWWDGYDPMVHTTILIDDYRGDRDASGLSLSDILNILDRWPHQVETKGGHLPFIAKKVYITSNVHTYEWWPTATKSDMEAFQRRIIHMDPTLPIEVAGNTSAATN